jgi:hypothetical protein
MLKINYEVEISPFILLMDLKRFPSKAIIKMKSRPPGWDDVEKDIRKLGEWVNVARPLFLISLPQSWIKSPFNLLHYTKSVTPTIFSNYQCPFFPFNLSKSPPFLGTASYSKSGPDGQFR